MMEVPEPWQPLLKQELEKPYYQDLMKFVEEEYQNHTVYPARENIFKALSLCPPDEVNVVILGQDPYHGPGQANGLAFSVNPDVPLPPSLRNIFKEYKQDTGKQPPANGDLTAWAQKGVLLLNATLTVRHKEPGSHQKKGWEEFTDAIIKKVSDASENAVFILWGSYAQKKKVLISSDHKVITSPHPSPLSAHRGFFGSKPFSQANSYLKSKKQTS